MNTAPCKNCIKRDVRKGYNCHDHCEVFKEFKAYRARINDERSRIAEFKAGFYDALKRNED